MVKACLLFFTCFNVTTHCFCQPVFSKDSAAKTYSVEKALTIIPAPETTKLSLKIYPNPAKNKISLQVTGFDAGPAIVKINDVKGKLCRQDNRLLTSSTDEITMFLFLTPGIYFISVSEKAKTIKKKLVVF